MVKNLEGIYLILLVPASSGSKVCTTGLQDYVSFQEPDTKVLNSEAISIDPRDLQENVRRIVHIFVYEIILYSQLKIDSQEKGMMRMQINVHY